MCPVLFKIGSISIYSYGVMVALAFCVCTYMIWVNAPRAGMKREKVVDFVTVIMISGIIGARLLHVAINAEYYLKHPIECFMLTRGGLAFYGGVMLSFFAGIIYLRMHNLPVLRTGDLVAPYAALGQAIGRIGCFLNGCCYGAPTDSSLGVVFPGNFYYRYPTQIYESILLIFIFIILRGFFSKGHFKGRLIFVYLMLYSVQRFFLDYLRGDLAVVYRNLTFSQLLSACIFIIGFIGIIWRGKSWKSIKS
jgi:phosphatidylglycerol:prolipoprotein diacylglycerol transferase